MAYKTPTNIILHKSKEVIFYIPNNKVKIDIDLWIKDLNLSNYKGMIIYSKCIFNRLKNDANIRKS